MQSLGERVLLLRRRHGLTQQALGGAARLNANTIARLERGEVHTLKGDAVARIAQTLHTTTDYLLGLSEDDQQESELVPTAKVSVGA
jgi:transcriptional regulator with XRE-family HTH domain